MTSPLRLGIIGLGHIGRIHIAAIEATPGLVVAALCDRDARFAELGSPEVPFFTDPDGLFTSRPDAVVIATPNGTHAELALESMRSGVPALVEKPAAPSISELDELLEASEGYGLPIYFAFHAAKAPEVLWCRDWLDGEGRELGPVTGFKASFVDPYRRGDDTLVSHAASLGDCWTDSGINALSVLSAYLDPSGLRPRRFEVLRGGDGGPLTHAEAIFDFPLQGNASGGEGRVITAWEQDVNRKETRLEFGLSRSAVLLDHTGQRAVLHGPSDDGRILADFSGKGERLLNHYLGIFADYLACRRSGRFRTEEAHQLHALLYGVQALSQGTAIPS